LSNSNKPLQSFSRIVTNRAADGTEQPLKTVNIGDNQVQFHTVLIAQLLSAVAATIICLLLSSIQMAVAVGYGALTMVIANGLLAHRIQAWSTRPPNSNAGAIAAARFVLVAGLLVVASLGGLWLPAVAGGLLIAQVAVYLAGFWLLVEK